MLAPSSTATTYQRIARRERCRHSSAPPAAGLSTKLLTPLTGVNSESAPGSQVTWPTNAIDAAHSTAHVTNVRLRR